MFWGCSVRRARRWCDTGSAHPASLLSRISRCAGQTVRRKTAEYPPARLLLPGDACGRRPIIVESLNRLARELFIQEYILRDLKQRGVTLLSATEPDLDSDPTRVMFRQIMGAIAEYDRKMIVLKLKDARKRMKAATGRCEGRKPFGERPGEAELLGRMRDLRAQGRTFDAIAAALNGEGVPTRTAGRRWFGSTVAKIMRRAVV